MQWRVHISNELPGDIIAGGPQIILQVTEFDQWMVLINSLAQQSVEISAEPFPPIGSLHKSIFLMSSPQSVPARRFSGDLLVLSPR